MSWGLTTSGACVRKAGKNCSSDLLGISGGAILINWGDQAESDICARTRRDWITLSGSTKASFKGILDDTASDMVATKMISYDMSGYTSRLEAQTMLDVMNDNINKNIKTLDEDKNKEVMF